MIKLVRNQIVWESYKKVNILTDGNDIFIELNDEDRVTK